MTNYKFAGASTIGVTSHQMNGDVTSINKTIDGEPHLGKKALDASLP